jgi:hypothetical protein
MKWEREQLMRRSLLIVDVSGFPMAGFTNLIREVEFYVRSTLFILRALFGNRLTRIITCFSIDPP